MKALHRVSEHEFQREVACFRVISLVIICCCWYNVDFLNSVVESVWKDQLFVSPLFKHDSFEPLLSTFVFGIVMLYWLIVDFYVPSMHRYRISPSDDVSAWKGREKAFWNETFWYISPWLVIDFFIPRRKLPVNAPTFPQIVWQIVLALVVFDIIFFIGHRCFHYFRFLYKNVHAEHHTAHTIRATDAIRHTFWDGSWDVFCSVVALNSTRAHPFSRALYNIVAITLISEAHSGMNYPWMLHNLLPFNIMAGPIVHDTHHRQGNVNFQKYFTYLDYLFGTLKIERQVRAEKLK
jgi:cholesterol 25-hydroxylase